MSEKLGLEDAVADGARRASLGALARVLASAITDREDDRSLASIAGRLVDTLAAIDQLPQPRGSSVDELAQRAARRREAASGTGGAATG